MNNRAPESTREPLAAGLVGPSDPVLVGAGDIASCRNSGASATATLIESIPGTVFTAGDNAYERGSVLDYQRCYGPTWGAFRTRTRPAPGNHEYASAGARAYFRYFGQLAGPAGKGWYAYDLGTWRIYVLNSNCSFVGGCSRGSPQERWLRNDLGSHPSQCILAYWHHPLYSSGAHGMDPSVRPFWRDLYAAHADVIINGHDHDYERFAPLSPYGKMSDAGIREFVVGTGGRGHRSFRVLMAHSVVRHAGASGVLKLTLGVDGYSWDFIPVAGQSFTDSGWGSCTSVPAPQPGRVSLGHIDNYR